MKYALVAAAASVVILGCDPAKKDRDAMPSTNAVQEMKNDARDALDATKTRLGETKDQFVAATQEKLNQLDQKITELGAKTETLKDDAKVEGNKALAALREQRAQLGQRFDELKKSSQEAWKDVKAGFESAYGELEKAYDNAKSKFSN